MSKDNNEYSSDPFLALLPERMTKFPRGPFDVCPMFTVSNGNIEKGYQQLWAVIEQYYSEGCKVIAVDGYQGVNWSEFSRSLMKEMEMSEIDVSIINISEVYASEEMISERIGQFLGGDDPIFGFHYPLGMDVFFDSQKLAALRTELAVTRAGRQEQLTIVLGPGASMTELYDRLWYIDIPKDYLQESFRNGGVNNIGSTAKVSFGDFYKRSYFVEWPALNRLKRQLLPELDIFIDLQNEAVPVFMPGDFFRQGLKEVSETPFRIRPWFYPGPWGGKFMQGHMGLDPEAPNFAWSFEMIVPENGILLEKDGVSIECSFDCLMYLYNNRVMGREAARQFKYEWPIRLDYLDTIDGGNLSVQVHPRPDYIRREFGETYTQDETYYIVAAKPDSQVYIGLTEDCDPDEFRNALNNSIATGEEVEIEKYVNKEPSKPHDLFLIPNGTVHCSGEGNLVLEISATPYIFTFKIYDYLRRDLEGNLRPINVERGFKNIRFERKKKWVQENLLASPKLLRSGEGWEEFELYNKPFTFYIINRAEFDAEFAFNTNGCAYAVNLVQGESVELTSGNGRTAKLSYLESMIIPAASGNVQIVNRGNIPCKLVMVYIRPGTGNAYPLNEPRE